MPKAIIELTCEECQSPFVKKKAEYVRTAKRGYRQFCSRKCGDAYKKKNGKEFVGHLDVWVKSDANLEHVNKIRGINADPFREFLRRARQRHQANNAKTLDLTLEQLKEVWHNQNGLCPYTGWALELPKHHCRKTQRTASLDRIDSSKGYIVGNIQFVSVMANFAKSDFDNTVMQEFCRAIKNHTPSD